jgi:AcrR family transcriptional regulator
MSRPLEPQKKAALLEQCVAATIELGTLDFSINKIAKQIGTSGRMLVYHFGSKQELDRQIVSLLEERIREKMWSFQDSTERDSDSPSDYLIKMWEHFTNPEMSGLLNLTMGLNQRAIQGDLETRLFLELETQKWIGALSEQLGEDVARSLFHLFQGAFLDFKTTGNIQRGRKTIEAFIENLH